MRASVVFSGRTLLLTALLVSGSVSISGCAQIESFGQMLKDAQKTSSGTASSGAESAPKTTETVKESPRQPAPLLSLKQIIRLIEKGDHDQAKAALETFLAKDPKNKLARSLYKQLTVDPEKALGPEVSSYQVQSGDTLGGLAARFLGDPMNFIILGRYNHIERGRDLQVGQTIKIPSLKKWKALPEAVHKPSPPPSTGEEPVLKPKPTEAHEPSAPENVQTTPETAQPKVIEKPTSSADEAKAMEAQQAGVAAMQKNQLEEAEQDFSKALSIDPSLELAKTRAAQVRMKLVQQYHEAALVAYRKQHLDEAIAWWDKALALDPNYEPALGYRARAQELKRRLGQLNEQ